MAIMIFQVILDFFRISLEYIIGPFFERIKDILTAPYRFSDMLWMLLPLLATLIMMEFYFGLHKDEELGWNTAVGNSLVLIFVSIDLFRHVHSLKGGEIFDNATSGDIKIIISLIVLAFGLILLLVDFFHFLPKNFAYAISSPAYINLISLMGIIIVYSKDVPLDLLTLFACIMIFLVANVIAQLIFYVVPGYKPPLARIMDIDDIEKYNKRKIIQK